MKVVIARSPEKIDARYQEVESLFSACYEKPLCRALWEQFHLNPPHGPPMGVLGFSGGELVGFYGLVPQRLCGPQNQRLDYLLGITLMLRPEHRRAATFLELMGAAMRAAEGEAVGLVMGFPNEQSYLPLVRLFRWQTISETTFCQIELSEETVLSKDELSVSPIENLSTGQLWCVPYGDSSYMRWRSSINSYHLVSVGDEIEVAYKILEPATLDVMDAVRLAPDGGGLGCLEHLARVNNCHRVLITTYHAALLGLPGEALKPASDYTLRLCALPFSQSVPDVHLSLLMSDVY